MTISGLNHSSKYISLSFVDIATSCCLALRDAAAEKAKASGLSLHDYILVAIKEKVQS